MVYTKQEWVDGETICTAGKMKHIEDGIADLYNAIFPIGQIVIKGDNEDYSNWLGFTWERTAVGKVLVGIDSNDTDFDTIGKIGGEKTHKLILNEMPSHQHTMYLSGGLTPDRQAINWATQGYQEFSGITKANDNISGGNQPHNILQPYQVVAYWKRIS